MKKRIIIALAAAMTIASASTAFAGWQQNDHGYWYQYDNGDYPKSGIRDIGGTNYAFNDQGYMLTGWQYISFRWYYLDPATGAQAIGWHQVAGKWYYLDPSNGGAMYTYWLNLGNNRYYLNEKGEMQTGVFYLSDSTSGSDYAYQADENGVLIRNTIKTNGNKTIKYDDNGIMMYRNDTTKAVAGATGDSSWQYVRNASDMQDQKIGNNEIITDEANSRKDSLYDEYKKRVNGAKNSQKENRRKAWENKVRLKLTGYLSEEEIDEYIEAVEKGRYLKSSVKKAAKKEDEEESTEEKNEDIDYYYDNYED